MLRRVTASLRPLEKSKNGMIKMQGYDLKSCPFAIIKTEVREVIIKIVQDDYIELRIKITDDGKQIKPADGEKIEFKSNVNTRSYAEDTDGGNGKTQICEQSDTVDAENRIAIKLDTAKFHIVPGKYHWELNLVKEDGTKTCLLPRDNNELIVLKREADIND